MIAERQTDRSAKDTQHRWQLRSNEVAGVLQNNGLDAHYMTGSTTQGSYVYAVQDFLQRGVTELGRLSRELTKRIGIEDIRVSERGDDLLIEIPQSTDVAVPLVDLLARHAQVPEVTAVLGLAEDGSTVFHNFRSHDTPHMLVVGDKNAGKTVLLRTIAASLAICNRQSDLQLAVISPVIGDQDEQRRQAAAWLPLNFLPHMLCDVAMKHTDIIDLLMFLVQEVRYREARLFRNPAIVAVVDQADIVISRGGRQALEALQTLAQFGEDAGIHLVLSVRKAEREQLSPQLMAEVPVLLRGQQTHDDAAGFRSVEDAEMEAADLLGEGDFIVVQGKRVLRMQGAMIDDYDLHAKLADMYRYKAILLAAPQSTRIRIGAQGHENEVTETVTDGVLRHASAVAD